jgi:hypothetical protein
MPVEGQTSTPIDNQLVQQKHRDAATPCIFEKEVNSAATEVLHEHSGNRIGPNFGFPKLTVSY